MLACRTHMGSAVVADTQKSSVGVNTILWGRCRCRSLQQHQLHGMALVHLREETDTLTRQRLVRASRIPHTMMSRKYSIVVLPTSGHSSGQPSLVWHGGRGEYLFHCQPMYYTVKCHFAYRACSSSRHRSLLAWAVACQCSHTTLVFEAHVRWFQVVAAVVARPMWRRG